MIRASSRLEKQTGKLDITVELYAPGKGQNGLRLRMKSKQFCKIMIFLKFGIPFLSLQLYFCIPANALTLAISII